MVEIVDSEEKIQTLLPWLDTVLGDGLVTLERARVLRYVAGEGGEGRKGGEGREGRS